MYVQMLPRLVLGLLLLVGLQCSFGSGMRSLLGLPNQSAQMVEHLLGSSLIERIQGATEGQVFRLSSDKHDASTRLVIQGYPVLATSEIIRGQELENFKQLLLRRDGFLFAPPKLCTFEPAIAFRLKRGTEVVEILICFSCDERMYHAEKESIYEHIDPIRPEFLRIAKMYFPTDKKLQELREEK